MSNGFMSVNTKLGAGRAFLRSLHEQYAAWGVDLGTMALLTYCQNIFIISLTTIMSILNLQSID